MNISLPRHEKKQGISVSLQSFKTETRCSLLILTDFFIIKLELEKHSSLKKSDYDTILNINRKITNNSTVGLQFYQNIKIFRNSHHVQDGAQPETAEVQFVFGGIKNCHYIIIIWK